MNQDELWMLQAIHLGVEHRYRAGDNPWVGCVIVKDNALVGLGFTTETAHAETNALIAAGSKAKNATLYVSLEPCSHTGRTPPCTRGIIQSGIAQVYISVQDPDTRVNSNGIKQLREAGIKVTTGVSKEAGERALRPYLFQRSKGLAYTLLKAASSLDGRIAAKDGSSQWITNSNARQDVHRLRAESQAILIGRKTALIDQPKLTVRHPTITPKTPPLRVVLDTEGKLPAEGPLLDQNLAPTLLFTGPNCPENTKSLWESRGVSVETIPLSSDGKIDLSAVLKNLASRGVIQVLVEGGSELQSAFLREKHAQALSIYYGNKILGQEGLSLFSSLNVSTLEEAITPKLAHVEQFDDCVRLDFELSCF